MKGKGDVALWRKRKREGDRDRQRERGGEIDKCAERYMYKAIENKRDIPRLKRRNREKEKK